jgi:glyoxylase-like metal-dependent hydrolase (beta-lactamase superfamily II)
MDGKKGLKETTRVTAPVALSTLGVNVFTAPGKAMVGERPKPFGEALGFDPITSTLIFGEYDAVLVDAMTTVAEAEALADWVALHNRNLETIYITHGHFDHFYGLSILLDRFPSARAIATPKTVNAMQMSFTPPVERPLTWLHLSPMSTTRSLSRARNCASSSRATPIVPIRRLSTFHRSA